MPDKDNETTGENTSGNSQPNERPVEPENEFFKGGEKNPKKEDIVRGS